MWEHLLGIQWGLGVWGWHLRGWGALREGWAQEEAREGLPASERLMLGEVPSSSR